MLVILMVGVVGLSGGVITGGHPKNLGLVKVRRWYLVGIAAAIQALLGWAPSPARWALIICGSAMLIAWCLVNRGQPQLRHGLPILSAGIVLNGTVIAANRGMPVSAAALRSAGLSPTMDVAHGHLFKHVAMTGSTHLAYLADRIPLPVGVLSAGDAIMLVGVAFTIWAATRHHPPMSFSGALVGHPAAGRALPALEVDIAGLQRKADPGSVHSLK